MTTAASSQAPHPSPRVYYAVFAALLLLLAATVAAAQFDLGRWNFPTATTIAALKGLLIILFFMHVRYSPPLTWLFAGAGFFWLVLLISLTFSDYITRPMRGEAETQSPSSSQHDSSQQQKTQPLAQ